jgi:hypothetical protein
MAAIQAAIELRRGVKFSIAVGGRAAGASLEMIGACCGVSQLHWRRNPEKAMIGTVYNARSDTPQSFRYASLSDIIRKALGGHQIAVAQTTHIDRAAGLVNHRAPAHIGGVAFLRLAGLPALGVRSTPPDGGGPDLSPALRPVHDGGDRRRGRSRRSGWRPRSAVTGKGGGH